MKSSDANAGRSRKMSNVPSSSGHVCNGAIYKWRLSRRDVDQVLRYTHWIPNTRGLTDRFFKRRYPGEDLSGFLAVFRASGILLRKGPGPPGLGRCHWALRYLYFSDASHLSVEWDDSVTGDDGLFL